MYLKKNIVCYKVCGKWQANYKADVICFALHRCCTDTKKEAMKIAREEVDFLNEKE